MHTKPVTVDILLRDIRAHCVDCMGGQRGMVAFCTSTKCRLWPHRLPPEEQDEPPMTASGGNLIGGEITRNKQSAHEGQLRRLRVREDYALPDDGDIQRAGRQMSMEEVMA